MPVISEILATCFVGGQLCLLTKIKKNAKAIAELD